ncbi:Ribokinase [Streptomyces tendae]
MATDTLKSKPGAQGAHGRSAPPAARQRRADRADRPVIAMSALSGDFLTADNLLNVGVQAAVTAILAFGVTFVIVTAGIDLSVGSVAALSATVLACRTEAGMPVVLAVLLSVLTGIACGLVNGFLSSTGNCRRSSRRSPCCRWAAVCRWSSRRARRSPSRTALARVGDDDYGRLLLDSQRAAGVDTVGAGGAPTGVALITVDPSGDNSIVVSPGANGRLAPGDVRAAASLSTLPGWSPRSWRSRCRRSWRRSARSPGRTAASC